LAILQHVAADAASAGVLAFKSGVDMELPTTAGDPALVAAVRSGEISEQDLNLAVERVLTAKFRAGLFEHPYADPKRAAELVGSKRNIDLARKVADEAIVLLKNRNNILPLDPARIKTIAVIGPNAVKMRLGTYSGVPSYYVSVLDGIRNRVGKGVTVIHAEGCRISEPDEAPNLNDLVTYKAPDEETEKRLIKEAVAAAASADVIVLALGGNEAVSRESIVDLGLSAYGDSDSLELPGMQNELVGEIAKLGKPVVAVVLNGKPYSLEKLSQQVPGIIEGWYLGQETGNAISGVLFGDTNPSGHLPVTIARNVGQLPVYYYKTSAARRGYVFHENTPLYPFGFGLHYTTFSFGAPSIDRKTISGSEKARVSVNVTNSGSRPGDEIVQMYVHHPVSSVVQPVIALRAFKRIHLAAGEIATVTFEVGADELSILNKDMKRVVEPGNVDILVGANAAETESVQVTVSE
ncbi:MAG TPA: glycoside hydrolase family 3 C-terminal domain-containing protein, partial [Bryobacteraceae bacterium]|nr:glycoside hydrolase family 3 C-terminal domain-containing protein [Bryobacteraceae bacterium]